MVNGVWNIPSPGHVLDTNPKYKFDQRTIVHVRFESTSTVSTGLGLNTVFWINVNGGAAKTSAILASLALQTDGTQTLSLLGKTNNSTVMTLTTVANLPAVLVDLWLSIETSTRNVVYNVSSKTATSSMNRQGNVTFPETEIPKGDDWATALVYPGAGSVRFDELSITACSP